MPRISDTVPIKNKSLDKRVKLNDDQRKAIKEEYEKGDTSYNKLAKKYGVSKRLVQFIVCPEKKLIAQKQFSDRQKDGRYYDKEKHKEYVKKHRNYKKELYENHLIGESK